MIDDADARAALIAAIDAETSAQARLAQAKAAQERAERFVAELAAEFNAAHAEAATDFTEASRAMADAIRAGSAPARPRNDDTEGSAARRARETAAAAALAAARAALDLIAEDRAEAQRQADAAPAAMRRLVDEVIALRAAKAADELRALREQTRQHAHFLIGCAAVIGPGAPSTLAASCAAVVEPEPAEPIAPEHGRVAAIGRRLQAWRDQLLRDPMTAWENVQAPAPEPIRRPAPALRAA